MGFFKKIFKGVGKVFKKIGKGIKKAFMKFGKFMNKAGILGQVAMAFILPGIGSALGSMVGAAAASANPLIAGMGKVLQFAGKVASAPGKVFSSITKGVTSTLTEFSKTALSKMGVEGKLVKGAAESFFFGPDSATSRVGTAITSPFTEKTVLNAIDKTTEELVTTGSEKAVEELGVKAGTEKTEQSLLGKVLDPLKEKATDKLEALGDPEKVGSALVKTLTSSQRENQEAIESYSVAGQPVEFGEFGAGAFQTSLVPEIQVAPLQTFQVPNVDIYNPVPISNFAKRIGDPNYAGGP
jgi:hypothetical protein